MAHRGQERALGFVRPFGGGARFLRLLEQACVLDRDHRLIGERLRQRDLLVVELAGGSTQDGDAADSLALAQQRYEQARLVP